MNFPTIYTQYSLFALETSYYQEVSLFNMICLPLHVDMKTDISLLRHITMILRKLKVDTVRRIIVSPLWIDINLLTLKKNLKIKQEINFIRDRVKFREYSFNNKGQCLPTYKCPRNSFDRARISDKKNKSRGVTCICSRFKRREICCISVGI